MTTNELIIGIIFLAFVFGVTMPQWTSYYYRDRDQGKRKNEDGF